MKSVAQQLHMIGGVNLNRDPRMIRPDQVAYAKNAFPVISGILGKRNGFGATNIGMFATGSRAIFVNSWATVPQGTGFLYVADVHVGAVAENNRSRVLIATDFNKVAAAPLGGTYTSIGQLQTEYEPTKFLQYRGLVIAIVPGFEGYYVLQPLAAGGYSWIKNTFKFDPATVGVQNSQAIPVTPRNAAVYKQRIAWGNFGAGKGNWIAMADKATSTVMQPLFGHSLMSLVGSDVLSLNGRHIEIGALEGEDITAMQEVTLGAVGTALESVLLVLTERSCVLVSGEILQTNDSGATDPNGLFGTYKEHRINYECGCVSQDTLVKTPYGWIWAAGDDVWMLRGNFPERIGTNIKPALLNCPQMAKRHWAAAYANGIYVLQLVTQTQAVTDFNQDITAYQHEYWYLDLREGPPESALDARWFGPMVNPLDANSNVCFSKVLSVKDRGGGERILVPGLILDTAPAGHRDLVIYDVLNGGSKDDLLPATVTAPEWQANTEYRVGDIVRPPVNAATAGRNGFMHVCTTAYRTLQFIAQAADFTNGETVRGLTSGATGLIVSQTDNGTDGTLILTSVTREFIAGEGLADTLGGDGVAVAASQPGTSGALDPTWATSSGGATTDNLLVWTEIRGVNEALGIRVETGRAVGHFTTDIRAVDYLLNDNTHEKLVRRVDVNVAASNKMNLSVAALLDQSNVSKSLGTNHFGGEDLQGDFGLIGSAIGGVKSRAKAFRPAETILVQCRTAQIKISDETSFVIDDTNDRFIVGFDGAQYIQVQLTRGNYTDIDAVLTELVAKLNAASASLATLGLTVGADPWSYVSAYSAAHPYFTRLRLTTSSVGLIVFGAIAVGEANATVAAGTFANDLTETTAYYTQSKRLAAMLGIYVDNAVSYPNANVFDFEGSQIAHKYNSRRFDIASAFVIVQPKTAIPFKGRNRS